MDKFARISEQTMTIQLEVVTPSLSTVGSSRHLLAIVLKFAIGSEATVPMLDKMVT